MKKEVTILIAEDDPGHATLIRKNLERAGVSNQIIHFLDGQQVIDFFYSNQAEKYDPNGSYLLLLDIRMPKLDGMEVLKRIKSDQTLERIPIIMITTTDDPREVSSCHSLGCNSYIVKPIEYNKFVEAIRSLGMYLLVVEVPKLKEEGIGNT